MLFFLIVAGSLKRIFGRKSSPTKSRILRSEVLTRTRANNCLVSTILDDSRHAPLAMCVLILSSCFRISCLRPTNRCTEPNLVAQLRSDSLDLTKLSKSFNSVDRRAVLSLLSLNHFAKQSSPSDSSRAFNVSFQAGESRKDGSCCIKASPDLSKVSSEPWQYQATYYKSLLSIEETLVKVSLVP